MCGMMQKRNPRRNPRRINPRENEAEEICEEIIAEKFYQNERYQTTHPRISHNTSRKIE